MVGIEQCLGCGWEEPAHLQDLIAESFAVIGRKYRRLTRCLGPDNRTVPADAGGSADRGRSWMGPDYRAGRMAASPSTQFSITIMLAGVAARLSGVLIIRTRVASALTS